MHCGYILDLCLAGETTATAMRDSRHTLSLITTIHTITPMHLSILLIHYIDTDTGTSTD